MSDIDERKRAWLDHCGLNHSEQDQRLRDRVAALFELKNPSRLQQEILTRADIRATLLTLPANAYRQQQQELVALIKREILFHTCKRLAWLAAAALLLAALAFFLIR